LSNDSDSAHGPLCTPASPPSWIGSGSAIDLGSGLLGGLLPSDPVSADGSGLATDLGPGRCPATPVLTRVVLLRNPATLPGAPKFFRQVFVHAQNLAAIQCASGFLGNAPETLARSMVTAMATPWQAPSAEESARYVRQCLFGSRGVAYARGLGHLLSPNMLEFVSRSTFVLTALHSGASTLNRTHGAASMHVHAHPGAPRKRRAAAYSARAANASTPLRLATQAVEWEQSKPALEALPACPCDLRGDALRRWQDAAKWTLAHARFLIRADSASADTLESIQARAKELSAQSGEARTAAQRLLAAAKGTAFAAAMRMSRDRPHPRAQGRTQEAQMLARSSP
jgi:hypothetical protein